MNKKRIKQLNWLAPFVVLFIFAINANAQISGSVFRDFNENGIKDNTASYNEVFVQGVTVTAFPVSGASQTTITNFSGSYSFTGLTLPVRIEFSGFAEYDYSGPSGLGNSTSVQFYSSPTSTANFGINTPDDYWDNTTDPRYVVPQHVNGLKTGNAGAVAGVVSTPLSSMGLNMNHDDDNGVFGTGPVVRDDILTSNIGTVWGEAYYKQNKQMFFTSFLKRHCDFGDGPGYIYSYNYSSTGTPTFTAKFNLQGVNPSNGGAAIDFGNVTRSGSADYTLSTLKENPNIDLDAFGKVAAMSYGDIDIQPGTGFLWTVNLFQKALIKIDVTNNPTSLPSSVDQYILANLPNYPVAQNGELRPFGLGFHKGKGFLGIVNDASNGTDNDLMAYILQFDPNNISAGFTVIMNFNPNIKKVGLPAMNNYHKWMNIYDNAIVYGSAPFKFWAQPVLSDINFDENNNMYVSFFDRFGHQVGAYNSMPISGGGALITTGAQGEILKACPTSTGWEIEGTGTCHTGAEFIDDIGGDANPESTEGAAAILMGLNSLISTIVDPHPQGITGTTYHTSQGVNTYNLSNGQISNWYGIYNGDRPFFGKANGLGDLEFVTEAAPIEIGNRVWLDSDNDGIQDADETGLSGIIVDLYQGATLVGTTTTDANGNYYFNASNVNQNGATKVEANTPYIIRIESVNISTSLSLTIVNGISNGLTGVADNDAVLINGNAEISYTTGKAGENNHTLDFGFKPLPIVTCPGPYGGNGAIGDPAQWIVIGNPGNPADGPSYSTVVNGNTIVHNDVNQVGYGSVNYTYSIADGFVTIKDYLRFLNAVDPTNTLNFEGDLLNHGLVVYSSGIWSAGTSYCTSLTQTEMEKVAVTRISLNQKARYANWVATGNVNSGAYSFASSDGNANITAIDTTFSGVRLLTENEYYKAAFWDPYNNKYNLFGTTGLQANGTPIVSGIGSSGVQTNALGVVYTLTTPDPNICWPQVQSGQGGRSAYGVSNLAGGFHNSLIPNSPIFPITNDLLRPDNLASSEVGQRSSFRRNDISAAGFYPSPSFQLARTGNACICEVVVVTAEPTACNSTNGTYGLSGIITFPTAPASGTLTISVPGGTPLVLNPPFLSPISYSIFGLPSNGSMNTVTATFSSGNACTNSKIYAAPSNGSIGNYVWSDLNNNGTNDEPATAGINGVTVELWDATNNNLVTSTTTANDGLSNPGFYNFIICTSGDYKIKFPISNSGNNLTSQTATTATDNNSDADATTGESPVFTIDVNGIGVAKDNNTIDAGYSTPFLVVPACLGNYVWNDANQDGIQNNGEVGVSGVTTTLYNATSNSILATVTTDAYGYYQFCGLNPGDYKVGFSLPSNYVFTGSNTGGNDEVDSDPSNITGLTATVTLASGDSNMTLDAGIYQPLPVTASVGNRVWFDADSDGIQDVIESGVSGITVSLYDCNNLGTPISTTITDANGFYLFENVVAGSYAVGVSLPLGMLFTQQNGPVSDAINSDLNPLTERSACFTVNAGDNLLYVDAGIVPKTNTSISLGDRVWNDANQDGIQDPSEGGVQGVTVTLYDATGTNVIYTTTTDGLGNYSFNGFPAGCYVVGFSLPSGYTRTLQNVGTDTAKNSDANAATGMTNQICISAGQNNPTIDAGIYNASNTNSIGDKVWYDEDKDGLQDPTEYGYPGVVVTLYDCSTNTIIATTTTNANGSYLFDGVANGDYYVGFGFVPGYSFTGANSDVAGVLGGSNSDANPSNGMTDCVSLAGNTNITTVDAGIYPGSNRNATSSLGDIVWTDANNNGLQDNDETGVSGVTVNLYNCSDLVTPVATTITDGLGNYIFTNLLGGNYAVGFSNLPAGYTFTTKGSNIEDEDNSDVNIATGQTDCIALGLGEDKMNVDAGIIAPAGTVCLGNYVWIDLDNDGTQEPNEPAVPGVTVKLYDNNTNTVLQVATTNSEGNYLFCGLTNGSTYSVGFENLPAGFSFTAQSGILSTPTNSDANPTTGRTTTVTMSSTNDLTLDAGIYSSSTAVVGNYVWYDEDADGIQDPTEAPIPGVLVTMYDNTNASVASAVTDANGGYLFTNVIPGTYTIGFEGYPSSLVPTTKGTSNPETADDDSNIDPITGRTDAFTVTAGSSNLTLDAGYKANPIAGLGNYVWYDVNEDGLQGANEPSIAGVLVTLYANDGTTVLGTAITDGNGAYSYPNLTADNYVVGFSNIPSGFTRTQSVGVLNDALNSDIGIGNKTSIITLQEGTYNPNIDAGFYFGVPLPVSLTQFNVYVNDCNVDLKWQTEKEQNTAYFNVFRKSEKDVNFVSIGEVKAAGNSQVMKNYTFRDLDVNAGSNQYKLQMVDLDGSIEESSIQVAVVDCSRQDAVSIYPNPTSSQLFVQFDNENSVSYTLNLRDIAGKLLKQTQLTTQGKRQIELDVNDLSSGLYSLEVVSNTEKKIFKLQLSK